MADFLCDHAGACHQGPAVSAAHLDAESAGTGASGWDEHLSGRHQAGHLRVLAHRDPAVAASGAGMVLAVGHSWRGQHGLRGADCAGSGQFAPCSGLCQPQPHGCCHAGAVLAELSGFAGWLVADAEPWHFRCRAVFCRGVSVHPDGRAGRVAHGRVATGGPVDGADISGHRPGRNRHAGNQWL